MPIYAYKCASCGHQQDALQKVSDAPLTDCPSCGAPALTKQVTAAGFQLKGNGWYATDFKNGPAAKGHDKDKDKAAVAKGDDKDAAAKGTGKGKEVASKGAAESAPAPAPTPAPASKAASPAPAGGGSSGAARG